MQTKLYTMTETSPDRQAIEAGAAALRRAAGRLSDRDGVRLGASAFNAAACARIFEVKRRPADKPLLCHLFSLEQAEEIAYLTDEAARSCAAIRRGR